MYAFVRIVKDNTVSVYNLKYYVLQNINSSSKFRLFVICSVNKRKSLKIIDIIDEKDFSIFYKKRLSFL